MLHIRNKAEKDIESWEEAGKHLNLRERAERVKASFPKMQSVGSMLSSVSPQHLMSESTLLTSVLGDGPVFNFILFFMETVFLPD